MFAFHFQPRTFPQKNTLLDAQFTQIHLANQKQTAL
jgi:hypothetical protein